jgi:hypothetical protein
MEEAQRIAPEIRRPGFGPQLIGERLIAQVQDTV